MLAGLHIAGKPQFNVPTPTGSAIGFSLVFGGYGDRMQTDQRFNVEDFEPPAFQAFHPERPIAKPMSLIERFDGN